MSAEERKEYVKAKGSAARVFNPGRRGGDSAWDAPPERPQQQPQANYDVGSGGARGARTEEEMQARRERARRERAETLERAVRGRSLWRDALVRLRANRAAIASLASRIMLKLPIRLTSMVRRKRSSE